jgi:molybdate transport system substrate-binding protein
VGRFGKEWAVVLAVIGLVATGCGSSGSGSKSKATTTAAPKLSGSITVSAAASLTEPFTTIGKSFKTANPGTNVTFNFGSSGTLATQIQQGAPADTFASADQDNMNKLVSANLVDGTPTVFAKNKLVIVTKPGNPKNVTGLADLPKLGVVSLCGTTVPCGKYAGQILQTAGLTIPESKITRGQDVKATLAAVTNGDADAAIVYVSDAKTAGSAVTSVTIPDGQNGIAVYPIATLKASGNKAVSQAFIASVTSPQGESVLQGDGFLPPS